MYQKTTSATNFKRVIWIANFVVDVIYTVPLAVV